MLNIDPTKRLVGSDKYRELIGAVLAASDADELWVEWKSTLDLRSRHGQFTVARAILGFTNRLPDDAQAYAGGYAYIVVGAEPGALHGVDEVDIAQLSPGLERYCGPALASSRYRFTYLPYDDGDGEKQVLVVEVEPPRWGDTIHTLHTDWDKHLAGTTFIRRPGQTERADAREMELLVDRARRQSPQLSVEAVEGIPLRPARMSPDDVNQWLAQEAAAVWSRGPVEVRPAPDPADEADGAGSVVGARVLPPDLLRIQENYLKTIKGLGFAGDPRTPSDYKAEAEAYLGALRRAFPGFLKDCAARRLTPLRLQLANLTTQNLTSLQLVVELPRGLVVAKELSGYERDDLPSRPLPFGEKPAFDFPSAALISGFHGGGPIVQWPQVRTTEVGTEITFPGVNLRPMRAVGLEPVVLVVAESTGSPIHATWSATATNVDAVIDGTLTLPVEGEPWTLDQILWRPAKGSA